PTPAPWTTQCTCTCGPSKSSTTASHPPGRTWSTFRPSAASPSAWASTTSSAAPSTTVTSSTTRTSACWARSWPAELGAPDRKHTANPARREESTVPHGSQRPLLELTDPHWIRCARDGGDDRGGHFRPGRAGRRAGRGVDAVGLPCRGSGGGLQLLLLHPLLSHQPFLGRNRDATQSRVWTRGRGWLGFAVHVRVDDPRRVPSRPNLRYLHAATVRDAGLRRVGPGAG